MSVFLSRYVDPGQLTGWPRVSNVVAETIRFTDNDLISSGFRTPNSTPEMALETGSAMFMPVFGAMVEEFRGWAGLRGEIAHEE